MDLKEVLENQIVLLDKVNQDLAGHEAFAAIRANVELIRALVQDIATLEQRPTLEDARVLVDKINVQGTQIAAINETLTGTSERLEDVEDTLETSEDENLIENILDRLEELEYKLATPSEDENLIENILDRLEELEYKLATPSEDGE